MPRQVYFSFHFERDIQRANVVRNSRRILTEDEEVGFYDHSLWEEAKTEGDPAIQALIDEGLEGASVNAVLIGAETYSREWVIYEIVASHNSGMGLLGIRLHNIRGWDQEVDLAGPNPFDYVSVPAPFGTRKPLSELYPVYDWVLKDGHANAPDWIEEAAQRAGR